MGNCLVKQYKDAASNNDLPKLNTITLDAQPDNNQGVLAIIAGDEDVNVTFKSSVRITSINGASVLNYSIPANTKILFYLNNVSEYIPDFVTIENIYKIKGIFSYTGSLIFSPTSHNSLKSMRFNSNLMTYGGYNTSLEDLPEDLKRLFIHTEDAKIINFDKLLSLNNIQVIQGIGKTASYMTPFIELTENTQENTSLYILGLRCKGSIVNLPINIEYLDSPTSSLEGNIEDYVTRVRAAGRNQGFICLKGKNDWHVSFNGRWLRELQQNGNILFTWDNSGPVLVPENSTSNQIAGLLHEYNSPFDWGPRAN